MENTDSKSGFWNLAGKAGLVLGAVSSVYMLIGQLLSSGASTTGAAFLLSLLSLVLWAAKFVGCILLMKLFMKKYAATDRSISNSDTFKFGMSVALLSSIVYSAFYFAYVSFIAPDTFATALSMISESYSSMMTSEAMEALENTNMERVSFFTNLIYCFIFGTILSAILSSNIPSKNPFDERYNNQENTDNQ